MSYQVAIRSSQKNSSLIKFVEVTMTCILTEEFQANNKPPALPIAGTKSKEVKLSLLTKYCILPQS